MELRFSGFSYKKIVSFGFICPVVIAAIGILLILVSQCPATFYSFGVFCLEVAGPIDIA
jgi:hypothetical protein